MMQAPMMKDYESDSRMMMEWNFEAHIPKTENTYIGGA